MSRSYLRGDYRPSLPVAILADWSQSWADKTPEYCLHLETIHRLFPRSKFVFIVRDGRDVALSLLGRSWGPNNVYTSAMHWKKCNEPRAIQRELAHQGLFYSMRYEDLLRKPHQQLTKLFEFLGQPYTNAHRANAERLIRPDNQGKFRVGLSESQLQLFESVAGPTLEHYGYTTSATRRSIPAWERCGYKLHDRIHFARHLFVLNVVDEIKIRFFGKEPFAE